MIILEFKVYVKCRQAMRCMIGCSFEAHVKYTPVLRCHRHSVIYHDGTNYRIYIFI
jgi:hypothetical protein